MKLVLTLLILLATSAISAQVEFKLKTTYTQGFVVYYPTPATMWITKRAFKAGSYPAENAYWTRYYAPLPQPQPSPVVIDPNAVTRATIDSLNKRLTVSEKFNTSWAGTVDSLRRINIWLLDRVTVLEKYPVLIDALSNDVRAIKNDTATILKVSLLGSPLLKVKPGQTPILRSLVSSPDFYFVETDSTLMPVKR